MPQPRLHHDLKPTLAELGLRVTVCIAALCEKSKRVVTVSDKKASFDGDFSSENLVRKNDPIWRDSTVLYAGNDITHVTPILDHARDLLRAGWHKAKQPRMRRHAVPPSMVADAIDAALGWRLQQEIERTVLRRFGFTVETFRRHGKQQCTDAQHGDICNRINRVDLGDLMFLLAGFDGQGIGHLWCIDGISSPRNYDEIGMWAIGSGARAALSTMAFHADSAHLRFKTSSVEAVAYCALTAKFMAESATDVGKSTFVAILRRDDVSFISPGDIELVRDRWKNEGAPRFPMTFISEELGQLIKQPHKL